ncbi:MAG: Gldg family protein [Bacteroidia bacterium]|jgi:gliding-associated putative ABC transporter substrate-binding component GldG|nr:Gldg family protein [Bacteroidia bacterium]
MRALLHFLVLLAAVVLVYLIGQRYFVRIDLTAEKRYTLSEGTKALLRRLPQAVYVTVYLEGEFPYPIQRYKRAIETLLAEMRAVAPKPFNYTFVNPSKSPEVLKSFKMRGVQPIPINVRVSQTETRRQYMYPVAVVQCGFQEIWIDLVKGNLYPTGEINLLEAEQEGEYKIAAALRQIAVYGEKPIIGILSGHGEYPLDQMPQLRAELERFYRVLPVRVKEGQALPPAKMFLPESLRQKLQGDGYAAILVIGPDSAFREREKYELEQYLLRGGRLLWLVDYHRINLTESSALTQLRELNLDDLFFRWGWRPGYDLVQDFSCGFIEVIRGYYNGPLWGAEKWLYYPVVYIFPPHPITRTVDAVLYRYAGSVDTLARPGVQHTILALSSPLSRSVKGTQLIDINLTLKNPPSPEAFKGKGFRPMAVLTEGIFESVFQDREPPTDSFAPKPPTARFLPRSGLPGKAILITDGELALPAEVQGRSADYVPLDNLTFLLNCVDYLAGEISLTQVRSRSVQIRRLNPEIVRAHATFIQAFNLGMPIVLMILFGLGLYFWRRNIYKRPLITKK